MELFDPKALHVSEETELLKPPPSAAPQPAASTTPPPAPTPGSQAPGEAPKNEMGTAIRDAAQALGIDAVDLATVISYETGGTFDPWKKGPRTKWGTHRGLIQWGEPQARKYGVSQSSTVTEQMQAVVRYLRDAGVQPGMGILDIYSAVNAGRVGRYNASDAQYTGRMVNGRPITVRDHVALMQKQHRGKAQAVLGGDEFTPRLTSRNIEPPTPAVPRAAEQQAAQLRLNAERDGRTGIDAVSDAFIQENITVRAWDTVKSFGNFEDDPNFRLTPEFQKAIMEEYKLAPQYADALNSAVSESHARFLAERAVEDQTREKHLSDAGWGGLGLRLAASILDPVAIGVGVASGGLADAAIFAAKGARFSRGVAQATAGAGSNVGLELALREMGNPNAGEHLLMSAAVGAMFGSAYGLLSRHPGTREEAAMIGDAASKMKDALMTSAADMGSVGAARNPAAQYPFLEDKAWNALQQSDAPHTFHKIFGISLPRYDVVGQLKSVKGRAYRLLGGHLAEDGTGNANHTVNHFSVAEDMEKHYRTWTTQLRTMWIPAATEWASDMGYTVAGRLRAGAEFNNEVYRYVINRDPGRTFHPAVQRVGEEIRKLNAEVLKLAKNPFEYEGLIGRAVQGFKDVPENPYYMMRAYDARKITEVRAQHGDAGIESLFRGAIRSADPDIDDDFLDVFARGLSRRVTERANGIDEKLNLTTSGFDRDELVQMLRDANVDESRINSFINSVRRDDKAGADPRAKRRVLLDENYVDPRTGLSIQDLVISDAAILSDLYLRHMAGRIALARLRVKNPTTGERIINGVTSDNEWLTIQQRAKKQGIDDGMTPEEVAKAEANMQFIYDRILGRQDPAQHGDWAKFLQRARKFMHTRIGWSFGFAQLPEMVVPIATLGVKAALSQMPAFRRIVNMDGRTILRDGLAAELEAILGVGTDRLRSMQFFRYDDFGATPGGVGTRVDNVLDFGVRVTNELSGMNLVNAALQRWTAKAIVQKFANMAMNPTRVSKKRMRSLGLSDEMLDRVLAQTKKHFSTEDGMLFKHKVTRMNLHAWDDLEARAAFENAVFRMGRRIIQENDIGNMHRWASKPLWQMLFQFRSFPLTAFHKQFLHGIHMRDMAAFNMMWMSVTMGAVVYAVQTQLAAMGRSDKKEFLEKRLSPKSLALGGFQRSAWSSILPMAFDTSAYLTGFDPLFDFRTTGQASDVLFGNPVMSFMDDLQKGMKGIQAPIREGRERSQLEYRNAARVFPMANWLPATTLLSTMISDKPMRPPYGNN